MSPRYTDKRLLNDLKLKIKILGRLPTKEEVDEDKNMANSSTYYDRFGGAAMLIDLNPDKPCELSLDLFIKFAKEFYVMNGRSPKTSDFDNNKKLPHSCYIRDICKLSWNEFFKLCELWLNQTLINLQTSVVMICGLSRLEIKVGSMTVSLYLMNFIVSYLKY